MYSLDTEESNHMYNRPITLFVHLRGRQISLSENFVIMIYWCESEASRDHIRTSSFSAHRDVVAVYVHICRSDFSDLIYQLNAEMYIIGLQRTLRLQSSCTENACESIKQKQDVHT